MVCKKEILLTSLSSLQNQDYLMKMDRDKYTIKLT